MAEVPVLEIYGGGEIVQRKEGLVALKTFVGFIVINMDIRQ